MNINPPFSSQPNLWEALRRLLSRRRGGTKAGPSNSRSIIVTCESYVKYLSLCISIYLYLQHIIGRCLDIAMSLPWSSERVRRVGLPTNWLTINRSTQNLCLTKYVYENLGTLWCRLVTIVEYKQYLPGTSRCAVVLCLNNSLSSRKVCWHDRSLMFVQSLFFWSRWIHIAWVDAALGFLCRIC